LNPTPVELVERQLRALDLWHRDRAAAQSAAEALTTSRELRMDLDRRLEVLRAQQAAIVERAEADLRQSVHLLHSTSARRAVVAHRNEWFREKVCADLRLRGLEVLVRTENGAEAVGAAVATQPDVVVVEDRLAMISGEEVVRAVRRYSPDSLVVAQVAYEDRIGTLLEAGADTAYTRRVPPADVSADVVRMLVREAQPA
jgi:ActR/RegA family two-component response regulator